MKGRWDRRSKLHCAHSLTTLLFDLLVLLELCSNTVRLLLDCLGFSSPQSLTVLLALFSVAAGENLALATLGNVLNFIKVQKIDMKKLQAELPAEALREKVRRVDSLWSVAGN